jgi:hypothetical protein
LKPLNMKKNMRYELNRILPWGRSFDEYVRMFNLVDEDGFTVSIEHVNYEFQRGGNEMLRIIKGKLSHFLGGIF